MTWTQPVCAERFHSMYPDREPVRASTTPKEFWDKCCYCQRPTNIYVRLDPKTVPYPREEES